MVRTGFARESPGSRNVNDRYLDWGKEFIFILSEMHVLRRHVYTPIHRYVGSNLQHGAGNENNSIHLNIKARGLELIDGFRIMTSGGRGDFGVCLVNSSSARS